MNGYALERKHGTGVGWRARLLYVLEHSRAPYFAIALIAFIARVSFMLVAQTYDFEKLTIEPPGWAIIDKHFDFGFETGSIAHWIAEGRGFASPFGHWSGPTAWIAPIYPTIVAIFFRIFGTFSTGSAIAVLTFNSACAALTCITVGLLAEKVFDREVGICSALCFALVPYFWRWPTTWVWEMPLSGLLLTIALLLTLRFHARSGYRMWIVLGAFWGMCALTNPTMLSVFPITLAWAWWRITRESQASFFTNARRNWMRPMLTITAFLVVITPWMVRNYVAFGKVVFIRGNAPAEIWFYNYPGSVGTDWAGRHPTQNKREFDHFMTVGELRYVAEKRDLAMQAIKADPGAFAASTWSRFGFIWAGLDWKYQKDGWWQYNSWQVQLLTTLSVLGLVWARFKRNEHVWLLVLAALMYPFAYYITFVTARYRHPIEPLLVILSLSFVLEVTRSVVSAMSRAFAREAIPQRELIQQ